MTQQQIERINELAKKKKTVGLTAEEEQEQLRLRREYIDSFRASLRAQLDNTIIVEPNGTLHQLKKKDN